MRISFPVEDFEGIDIPFLIYVSCIELAILLLAKDYYLRCLIAGQTFALVSIRSTY
jgi:hypothetical protein